MLGSKLEAAQAEAVRADARGESAMLLHMQRAHAAGEAAAAAEERARTAEDALAVAGAEAARLQEAVCPSYSHR